MIPYSYNMVDMGGIDLAEAHGTVVEGLYNRLTLARNACGDLILYNWKFAEIEIVPGICTTLDEGTSILINGAIQVTEQDEVFISGILPEPTLVSLTAAANGIYLPEVGVDGFSRVEVAVPPTPPPPPNSFVVSTAAGDYTTGWYGSRRITRVLQSGLLVCGLWCVGNWTCGCYYTLTNYGDKSNVITGDYTAASVSTIDGKTVYLYGGMNGAGDRTIATFNFSEQNKSTTYSYRGVGANYLYGPTNEANGGQYFQGMSDALKEEFWRLLSLT